MRKNRTIRVVYVNDNGGHFEKLFHTDKSIDEIELLLKIQSCDDPEIVAIRKSGKVSHITLPV